MKKLVVLLFFCFLGTTAAAEETDPTIGQKAAWLLNMQKTLPVTLCDPHHAFLKCYNLTQEQCVEKTTLYVKACLDNIALALPDTLDQQEGERWGKTVGRCSYDLYEKFMRSKKRNLPDCQSSSKVPHE